MTFEEAVKNLVLKHPFTNECISPRELISILKEDVVQAVERPGSWEGSKMLAILEAHGFFNEN